MSGKHGRPRRGESTITLERADDVVAGAARTDAARTPTSVGRRAAVGRRHAGVPSRAAEPDAAEPAATKLAAAKLAAAEQSAEASFGLSHEAGLSQATLTQSKVIHDVTPHASTPTGGRRAGRGRTGPPRRILLATGGGLVALALVIWTLVVQLGGSPGHHSLSAASGARTQSTVLVQLQGPLGDAVDSALIAHDPASRQGVVVLVPSGVISQVPGFGTMQFGKASALGQPDTPRTTLADLLGVTIDGSWSLSAKALQTLVDRVGGVDVAVDTDVTKPGPNGSTTIVVPAGQHHLGGSSAVAYATFLGTAEAEQARLARFDEVFRALLAKLPQQPGAVVPLLSGLGAGASSSLPTTRLADLLVGLAGDNAKAAMVDTVLPVTRIDAGSDLEAFSLDAAKTAVFVKGHLAQSIPPNQKVTGNRVMVENQVGTPGIGETTREKLIKAGFTYVPGANAPGMPNATAPSVVLITGKTSADIAKGNAVAAALGVPASDLRVSTEHVQVADVIVLLGADYKP